LTKKEDKIVPCPECNAPDIKCIKFGFTYRKTTVGAGNIQGAKVRQYQCTKCGYKGRGSRFKLPEFDGEPPEPLDTQEE
jgi:hypothetical protein